MEFIKTETADLSKLIIVVEKTKNGGCTKKIYRSLLDMPPAERNAYIAQAFSNVSNNRISPEETWTRMCLERLIDARIAKNAHHR